AFDPFFVGHASQRCVALSTRRPPMFAGKQVPNVIVGLVIAVALTFASSTLLTLFVRKHALRIGMLDIPNSRSSHATPTPRGGGVAIVVATSLGMSALSAMGLLDTDLLTALLGGLLIASVGYLDDRHSLPVGTRLVCHFGAAVWAISWIGEPPS